MRDLMGYPVEKIATDLNRCIKVEDIQMVNKQTNIFLNCCIEFPGGKNQILAKNQIERKCGVLAGHLVEIPK